MNKVILIGECEEAPKITPFPNGKRVANFTLVTSEHWKDTKTGDDKSRTDRHKVAVFNDRLCDQIASRVSKNTMLYIEGRIENRIWTDTKGQQQHAIDIVIRPQKGELIILGPDAKPV